MKFTKMFSLRMFMMFFLLGTTEIRTAEAEDVIITGFPGGLSYLMAPITKEYENFATMKGIFDVVRAKTGVAFRVTNRMLSDASPEERVPALKTTLKGIADGSLSIFVATAPLTKYAAELSAAGETLPTGIEQILIGSWDCDLIQGAQYQDHDPVGLLVRKINKAQFSRVLLGKKPLSWASIGSRRTVLFDNEQVPLVYERNTVGYNALKIFAGNQSFGVNTVDMTAIQNVTQGMGLFGSMVANDNARYGASQILTVVPHDREKAKTAVNVVKQVDFNLAAPVYVFVSKTPSADTLKVVNYFKNPF